MLDVEGTAACRRRRFKEDEVGALAPEAARGLCLFWFRLARTRGGGQEAAMLTIRCRSNRPACAFEHIQPQHAQHILQRPPALPGARNIHNELPVASRGQDPAFIIANRIAAGTRTEEEDNDAHARTQISCTHTRI